MNDQLALAQTLSTVAIVSFVLAVVFGILAIWLCVFLQIPSVIGDLSGWTAKKEIEKMRKKNEENGGDDSSLFTGDHLQTASGRRVEHNATGLLNTRHGGFKRREARVKITMIDDIMFIDTNEVI